MEEKPKKVLDQLESALLKFAPASGGIVGGLSGAAFIGGRGPPILGAVLGGAVGAVLVVAVVKSAFAVINPKRREEE